MQTEEPTPTTEEPADELTEDTPGALKVDGDFLVFPLSGPWERPQATDPKELRIRRDVYVEDVAERDFYKEHQKRAWATALIAGLSNVSEGMLRRCSHGDSDRIMQLADAMERATIPSEFHEEDGRTKVIISRPLRDARTDKEKKEQAPGHIWWRTLSNQDLIRAEDMDDGHFGQQMHLVANVAGVPVSVVKRLHIADWIALSVVMENYRKKGQASS